MIEKYWAQDDNVRKEIHRLRSYFTKSSTVDELESAIKEAAVGSLYAGDKFRPLLMSTLDEAHQRLASKLLEPIARTVK